MPQGSARALAYFSAYMVSRIVPEGTGNWIADTASGMAHALKKRERASVRENLATALRLPATSEKVLTATRNVYRNFGRSCVDLLYRTKSKSLPLLPDLQIVNRHFIDEALAHRKGVVLAGAHTGLWELGAMALASRRYPLTILSAHAPAAGVLDLYRKHRERVGLHVVGAHEGMMKCVRVLQQGGILGVMADPHAGMGRGVETTFFGRRAMFPQGAARLALLCGAPIVGATLRRNAQGRPVLKFWERIDVPEFSPDALESVQEKVVRLVEAMIGEKPEAWCCFEPIFKF